MLKRKFLSKTFVTTAFWCILPFWMMPRSLLLAQWLSTFPCSICDLPDMLFVTSLWFPGTYYSLRLFTWPLDEYQLFRKAFPDPPLLKKKKKKGMFHFSISSYPALLCFPGWKHLPQSEILFIIYPLIKNVNPTRAGTTCMHTHTHT